MAAVEVLELAAHDVGAGADIVGVALLEHGPDIDGPLDTTQIRIPRRWFDALDDAAIAGRT